jgi:hypothetical protein
MALTETNIVNAFETTLAAQLASGGTTMNLTDDPGVAAPAYFVIAPDSDSAREVIKWDSGAYNNASVTRDLDSKHGTDPTHASGTTVRLAVVKQHIEDAHDRINDIALTGDVTGTLASATQDIAVTIANNAVETAMINADAVDGTKIADDAIDSEHYVDGSIDTAHLAADAVTEAKIADDAVESEHLNDNVISGQTELASGLALTDELLVSDAGTVKRMDVSLIADAIDGDGIDVSSGTLVNAAIGKQSMWIPATAMYPTNTGGCAAIALTETTAGRPDMYTLDFDASSDENAQFSVAMPSFWNEGTITYQVYWTTTATDTDGVAWSLSGVVCSDNDTIDVAFGTAVVVTDDALGAAEDLCVTAESGAVTLGGSPAAGDLAYFNIERDVSDANDDMTEDAKLIGIKLFYTVDDVHEA